MEGADVKCERKYKACTWSTLQKRKTESTYAKVHGSVSVNALQRKEAEESACGKMHDPAFKITEIYFQEKLLCNVLVKNGNN